MGISVTDETLQRSGCFLCDSNTVFVCAKAKRQQHGFYLCESEATATTKRPAGAEINHTLW
ncbi:hypothetical protein [Lysinibacillus sp. fls2-241-R2A-57]|uniref:hypothetical protein n=1 Tax=Lysinibacillus sp. fls2-241-R2A-57 TaxID=3040292 RepID=UPI0025539445|nr:hypothetical protein [Lysinibacillus sp. fls2-241-R2A-57]